MRHSVASTKVSGSLRDFPSIKNRSVRFGVSAIAHRAPRVWPVLTTPARRPQRPVCRDTEPGGLACTSQGENAH